MLGLWAAEQQVFAAAAIYRIHSFPRSEDENRIDSESALAHLDCRRELPQLMEVSPPWPISHDIAIILSFQNLFTLLHRSIPRSAEKYARVPR